ncbi:MAG: NAD(P)H-hydrate dehydratase [Myxococcales bacterium]|nr:NAD(P)H-hydrate dehydratase [Myxococcales bacterium]
MKVVLTAEQMRAYDAHALEQCGVPGIILMENAGRGAADIIERLVRGDERSVVIVCGHGNNGGDGFVVGRQLLARGTSVVVFLIGTRAEVEGDARTNLDALDGLGVEVVSVGDELGPLREALAGAAACVDALFGTGLSRPLEGVWREVVLAMDEASCPAIALDVPSGIDATSGAVLGAAVHASVTITFGHLKTGLLQGAGVAYAGEVHTIGLGIPDDTIVATVGCTARTIAVHEAAAVLGVRARDIHKYEAGSVLVIAGSPGKTGAALLAAEAALRAGAGLVTIGTTPAVCDKLDGRVREVMTCAIDAGALEQTLAEALRKRDAVAIGPGLGYDEGTRRLVEAVVLGWHGPVIVDADAIGQFNGRPEALRAAPGPRVLTPHAGELARLIGESPETIALDRFGAVARAADRSGAVVVLKGAYTLVASPNDDTRVCDAAEPLLATAGSGDVLTGILAALAVGTASLEQLHAAACAGVYLHARAASLWNAERGLDRGMLAGELVSMVAPAIAEVLSG